MMVTTLSFTIAALDGSNQETYGDYETAVELAIVRAIRSMHSVSFRDNRAKMICFIAPDGQRTRWRDDSSKETCT